MPEVPRILGRAAALVVALAVAGAQAQHADQKTIPGAAPMVAPAAQPAAPQGPFRVTNYGAFGTMLMQRDFATKVVLRRAIGNKVDGVGALSDARGEITILEDAPIVSYGVGEHHPPADETAMLLSTARVYDWQEVAVDRDVPSNEIEGFLASQARAHGLDPEQSFPFRIRGTLKDYAMHVIAGPAPGRPPLTYLSRKGEALAGLAVGIYVGPALVGVTTHPGERTHTHWVRDDRAETAHLDRWGLLAGAVLLLPKGP
jgi:hypothetical protein